MGRTTKITRAIAVAVTVGCGEGDFHQVRVDTGSTTTHSGDSREDAAIKLARQVLTRA